jgi:hypothetical protein
MSDLFIPGKDLDMALRLYKDIEDASDSVFGSLEKWKAFRIECFEPLLKELKKRREAIEKPKK